MKKFRKVAALGLAVSMILGMLTISASAAEAGTYSDVSEEDWFTTAVEYVTAQGYMNGVAADLFAPGMETNRAMVVTVLYRMETEFEEVEAAAFTDLDTENGKWYIDAVAWAAANDIAKGYEDGTFQPMKSVTREELVTFFYRWAQYKGYKTSLEADLSAYIDAAQVQPYARAAMAWAVAAGLIKGVTSNTLCPVAAAKRAEIAQVIYRLTDDEKVIAAITIDEELGENDTPLSETPDLPDYSHVHTFGAWTVATPASCTEEGVETRSCTDGDLTQTRAIPATGHSYVDGVCACGDKTAETLFAAALAKLNGILAGIQGNGDAQLVTITGANGNYAATLNTDAIKGSGQSFSDELLNGLVTNAKATLDKYFEGYTLTVNGKSVYANKAFDNSALKAAIYDVAGGFFYNLSKLEANNGLYKTVTAAVVGEGTDKFEFTLDIKLSGGDVEKVQKMADILEKHLAMTTMSAEEVNTEYGVSVSGESKYIVVKAEMPDAAMKSLEALFAQTNSMKDDFGETGEIIVDAEDKAEVVNMFTKWFDGKTVNGAMVTMQGMNIGGLVGSGEEEINTLISMVNGNANLVNKVLSKLTISVTPQNGDTVKLVKTGSNVFDPKGEGWSNLMSAVSGMLTAEGGALKINQFAIRQDYYLVPVTVEINLGETFQGTETVLVELHIPLSEMIEVKTAE